MKVIWRLEKVASAFSKTTATYTLPFQYFSSIQLDVTSVISKFYTIPTFQTTFTFLLRM